MQARQFWPPTKHKLLYANLIVYGVTIVLLLVFHHELIWAQKTLRGYVLSGNFEPTADNLLIREAIKCAKTGEGTERIQHLLERASKIEPYGRAQLLLGACHFRQGEDDKALVCYERYRSVNPSSIEVYIEMVKILEKKQEREAMEQLLTEGIRHFRRRVELYQPHHDPTVRKEFNVKALEIYNASKESLKLLEKMQKQSNDFK